MTAVSFSVDGLPDLEAYGSVPGAITESPVADLAAERDRLIRQQAAARAELVKIARREGKARADDRAALSSAMADGKPDPGEQHIEQLAAEFAAQRRRVIGLTDAANNAHARLHTALQGPDADTWRDQLDAARAKTAERVDELADALAAAIAEDHATFQAIDWLAKCDDPSRAGRGLPTPSGGARPVELGRTPWPLVEVLDAIRDVVA